MENSLRAYVLGNAPFAAAIGSRLYPVEFPQNSQFPAMTYQVVSGPRDYTQAGADGVVTFRIQSRIYATSYNAAKACRDLFEAGLSGTHGFTNESPPVYVSGLFIANETDEVAEPLVVSGPKLYGKRIDFFITLGQGPHPAP